MYYEPWVAFCWTYIELLDACVFNVLAVLVFHSRTESVWQEVRYSSFLSYTFYFLLG
jgi:hypothetical protein